MAYIIKPSVIAFGDNNIFQQNERGRIGNQPPQKTRGYIEIKAGDFPAIPYNATIISARLSFQQFALAELGTEMVGAWVTDTNWWESMPATSTMNRLIEFGQTTIPLGQRAGGTITSLLQDAIRTGITKRIIIDTINNLNYQKYTWIEDIQIEVVYVIPPVITAPNGNTIKKVENNGRFKINWSSAQVVGDSGISDGKYALLYKPEYQANPIIDGFTPLINAPDSWDGAVTSYTHEFGNETSSSSRGSQLAILFTFTMDSKLYRSEYSFSPKFIVDNNLPPTKPTNLIPNFNENRNVSEPIVLMWKHNDPNTGDAQSKALVRYKTATGNTWSERNVSGSQTTTTIAAGTLTIGVHEWQVKTWDIAGLESPWSDWATFNASNVGNGPVLIAPGDYTNERRVIAKWVEPQQVSMQVRLAEINAPDVYLWDSGEVHTNSNDRVIEHDLIDGTTYIVSVRVIRSDGVWSSWGTKTVIADFSQASAPTLDAYPLESGIRLVVSGDGTADKYYIYKYAVGSWMKIAFIDAVDSNQFVDYAVASGKETLYRATSVTVAGNETFSNEVSGMIKFQGVYLHTVDRPSTLHLFKYGGNERGYTKEIEHGYREPVGRTRPTVEFGTMANANISTNIQIITGSGDNEALDLFLENRKEVCYRDNRGRIMFGILTVGSLVHEFFGYTTTIIITETDYTEEIV